MTVNDESDREIERLFQAQRDRDGRGVPSFARVVAGRTPRRSPRMWWPALAGATALVMLAVLWRDRPAQQVAPFVITVGDLRGPTDFLLDMAATGTRAGEVPEIGDINWYPLTPKMLDGAASDTRRNEL